MELRFDVIKGQKFDIGRTINPIICDCAKCTYLTCPKKNYAPKTKRHIYTVEEFFTENSSYIKNDGYFDECMEYELFDEILGDCFNFPKGLYYSLDTDLYSVDFVALSRSGSEVLKGRINLRNLNVIPYDTAETQYKFLCRVADGLKKLDSIRSINRGV